MTLSTVVLPRSCPHLMLLSLACPLRNSYLFLNLLLVNNCGVELISCYYSVLFPTIINERDLWGYTCFSCHHFSNVFSFTFLCFVIILKLNVMLAVQLKYLEIIFSSTRTNSFQQIAVLPTKSFQDFWLTFKIKSSNIFRN